ncbi:ribosomal protein S18 acetylase RimI-like enzyme [Micromonospora pisi]|uniref:Ribosomal protein S18 acetylase RimI-like enzyme n=1 Tax=Micromonospora pisi TaxID=589240 RepID=A0A495JW23_9ACTN|nr:GNAT family N-acetyltransferase [Micromonospora pisi]RKR93140.1 ribosomal protein S18 acetylase RimI-like enzyme [Micromonospora pisi]
MRLRAATPDDLELLHRLLFEAFNWADEPALSRAQMEADPQVMHYVTGWQRPSDFGTVAIDEAGEPLGAVWARVFPADDPGYGFVDVDVPELSMAVLPGHRGQGIGRALLRAVAGQALALGWEQVSLSVEDDNRAASLYASVGFRVVGRNGGSDTMVLDLYASDTADAHG